KDLDFPDRVYKVKKAMYGLHQAPRAWYKGDILLVQVYVDDIIFGSSKKEICNAFENQDKYVDEILKKFGFTEVKTASTPIETQKPLLKDENGKEVDVHMNRSMIGSLMYLTSSRPNIMFAVCACARYQVNPKIVVANSIIEAEYVAAQVVVDKCFGFRINYLNMVLLVIPNTAELMLLVILNTARKSKEKLD
ncbi:hypothetical protein Tco_1267621, partial [Tanacetum coccineum]